jgi:hypothetical protein
MGFVSSEKNHGLLAIKCSHVICAQITTRHKLIKSDRGRRL